MSSGTYFKLLDLEISGDLEILEMIGDDICIYMSNMSNMSNMPWCICTTASLSIRLLMGI